MFRAMRGSVLRLLVLGICMCVTEVTRATVASEDKVGKAKEQRLLEEFRKKLRQRMHSLPTVTYELTKMTVYPNAVVTELLVTNNTQMALRVFLPTEFSTIRVFRFRDEQGNPWEIPELQAFYSWGPAREDNSPIVEKTEKLRLLLVDVFDNVELRPAKGGKKVQAKQPRFLQYEHESIHSMLRRDLSASPNSVSVHLIACKNYVPVEWKRFLLPNEIHTKVLPLHPE